MSMQRRLYVNFFSSKLDNITRNCTRKMYFIPEAQCIDKMYTNALSEQVAPAADTCKGWAKNKATLFYGFNFNYVNMMP